MSAPPLKTWTQAVDTSPLVIFVDQLAYANTYMTIENVGLNPLVGDLFSSEGDAVAYANLYLLNLSDTDNPIVSGDTRLIQIPQIRGQKLRLRIWTTTGSSTVVVRLWNSNLDR